jgi:O-antigen/teichoic acid export membrane protein
MQANWLHRAMHSLVSDSFVHFVGAGLLGLGSFVLVPLYTRTLRPAQFGIYALIDVTILILALVSQLKLDVAYLKTFADVASEKHSALLGSVLITGFSCSTLVGLVFAAIVASPFGSRFLQATDRGFAWTLLPIVVLEALQGLLLSDLRARRRAVLYCVSTLTRLLAMVGATVWLLSFRHWELYGLFLGRMLGDLAGVLLLLFFCRRNLSLCFDWPVLRPMVHFGMPLIWGAFMMLLMDAAGRYILTQYHGLTEVGYLGSAVKISSVFQMLVAQPFGIAWGGLMFQMARWPNAKLIYSQLFTYLLFLSSGVALGVAVFTRQLFHIFATPAYAPGMVLLPYLLLVRAIGIMEYPAGISIYLAGRTYWFAGIYTIAFAVNCGLNVWLDKTQGAMGVVVSWIAGWIVIAVLMRAIGQRVYRLENHWLLWAVSISPWLGLVVLPRERLARMLQVNYLVQSLFGALIVGCLAIFVIVEYRRIRRYSAQELEISDFEVCVAE